MKTCVVNTRFVNMRTTGVQRSAREIVGRLLAEDPGGGEFRLVAPPSPGLSAEGDPAPWPVERRGRLRRGHAWEQLELPGTVRAAAPDAVLYSPMTSGPVAVTRQVLTVHDLFPIEHPEWFSRAFSAWYRVLLPVLVRRVAFVVANSEHTRRGVLERFGVPGWKVVTCPFAQDERFAPAPAGDLERFRAERGLPERYVLTIGSIEPRKNLGTLVAAWGRTQARERGAKLVVAGGVGRKEIFNLASLPGTATSSEDPTVVRVGFFPDEELPLLYAGAEAFALPSLAEGFGLPILEAMACGTPVICADATAMPEVAGGAARLVEPLDAEAWTDAIDAVLDDPEGRRRMSAAGLRRAARFSWDKTAAGVRGVLEMV